MNYFSSQIDEKAKISISDYLPGPDSDDSIKYIVEGLNATPKYISSKFFYDAYGSELFEQITGLEEYYPSRTEKSILKSVASELVATKKYLNIIELGSGDSSKISILLDAIPENDLESIRYFPVDVSESAILKSSEFLSYRYPEIEIHGLLADFMEHLTKLPGRGARLICFFGSTLGNLSRQQSIGFLKDLKDRMQPGDSVLIGLDMVKDINKLEDAYNDKQGVTSAFNKNILRVVNQILKSDFSPENFEHYAFYDSRKARIEMHLNALRNMEVSSPFFQQNINLRKGESIHTENSHKFTPEHISDLAILSGLSIRKIYSDKNNWFNLVHFEYPEKKAMPYEK